jgi:tRNA pseudouridine32 synthase / 23S rRNA pseudouridine746 synthase
MLRVAINPENAPDWLTALAAALAARGHALRRAELRELVKSGRVLKDGKPLRLNAPLAECWVEVPLQETQVETPTVVFQDDHLLVVSKPPGLLTHASADRSRSDLVSWVRQTLAPHAVLQHRLDRETSGLVLFTLSTEACAPVAQAFAEGRVAKTYIARVTGSPPAAGEVDLALGETRGRVRVDRGGKPARTLFRRLGQVAGGAWLELRPQQGRKHQLRVHCAHMGWPIEGDPLYGGKPSERLWLHAWKLRLQHPLENRPLDLRAEPGVGWLTS